MHLDVPESERTSQQMCTSLSSCLQVSVSQSLLLTIFLRCLDISKVLDGVVPGPCLERGERLDSLHPEISMSLAFLHKRLRTHLVARRRNSRSFRCSKYTEARRTVLTMCENTGESFTASENLYVRRFPLYQTVGSKK